MSAGRARLLIAAQALALLAACGRAQSGGPVRTPEAARDVAQHALQSAHLDEQVTAFVEAVVRPYRGLAA